MSAVLESEERMSIAVPERGTIEIREGDWQTYRHCIAVCSQDESVIARYGSRAAYQRACAMAYLGRRAQIHGGVCSTRHPHVITAQFVADLEAGNRSARYARYPWLRTLMSLLEDIERIQDQASGANVISLVPSQNK